MHVLERGAGRAHVWLHGFMGNSLNLTPLAKDFSGAHLFPDARNHGRSAHTPDMSIPAQAKDVISLLDSRNLPSAVLIGHSMGAKVALEVAVTWPKRVTHLVLMDIAPVDYNLMLERAGDLKFYLQQMQSISLQGKRRDQVNKELMERIRDKKVVDLLGSNLVTEAGELKWRCGVKELLGAADHVAEWDKSQGVYTGPALVLVGEMSRHTCRLPLRGVSLESLYTKNLSNFKIQVIKGAGHWLHVDKQSETRQALLNFLGTDSS